MLQHTSGNKTERDSEGEHLKIKTMPEPTDAFRKIQLKTVL